LFAVEDVGWDSQIAPITNAIMNQVLVRNIWKRCKAVARPKRMMNMIVAAMLGW